MATGEDNTSDFNIKECPVCLDKFKRPKVLPCQHIVCEECLSTFIESTRLDNGGTLLSFPCPVCRTTVVPIDISTPTDQWASLMPTNQQLDFLSHQTCEFCLALGKSVSASIWCKQCIASICNTCKSYHKTIRVTSSHDLIPITEIKADAFDVMLLDDTCLQHKGKTLELFCTAHHQAFCVECLISQHLQCAGIRTLEDVAEEAEQTDDGIDDTVKYLDNLQKTALSVFREKKENIGFLQQSRDKILQQINCLIKQMKEKLDNFEECFSERLTAHCKEKIIILEDMISHIQRFITDVKNSQCTLKIVSSRGTKIQKLLATEKVTGRLGSHFEQLKESVGTENEVRIKADIDIDKLCDEIEKMLNAKIPIETEELVPDATLAVVDITKLLPGAMYWTKTPVLSFTKCLKTYNDVQKPFALGGTYLANGSLLINDCRNHKVKLFTESGEFIRQYSVANPRRLCQGNQSEAFVLCSVSSNKVCRRFNKALEVQQTIKLGSAATSIARCDTKLAILYNSSDQPLSTVELYDTVTEQKTTVVTLPREHTETIKNMAISNRTGNIYCTDDDTLRCYSPETKLLFKYKPEALKIPCGVALDPKDNVYVCDRALGSVHQVSSDGRRSRILLPNLKGIKEPYGIGFHPKGKQFFISSSGDNESFSVYSF